jgi:hypothetical protein
VRDGLILSVRAGVIYAVTVFAIGFLLGAVRVLLLVPRVGPSIAVSVEAPIMLAVSWLVASISIARLAVGPGIRTRIVMGLVAFVTLTILELTLSMIVFHTSVYEYLSGLRSVAGVIGLAAQGCFATFPLLNVFVRGR